MLDLSYVRLYISVEIFDGTDSSVREIPFHRCTEDDYAKFYEISPYDKHHFEKTKNDPA